MRPHEQPTVTKYSPSTGAEVAGMQRSFSNSGWSWRNCFSAINTSNGFLEPLACTDNDGRESMYCIMTDETDGCLLVDAVDVASCLSYVLNRLRRLCGGLLLGWRSSKSVFPATLSSSGWHRSSATFSTSAVHK